MSCKNTLAALLSAGGLMALPHTATAGLKEGDAAIKVGGAYVVPGDSTVKLESNTHNIGKLKLKEDSNPITAGFDVLFMATDEIGVNLGTLWPAKVKQKATDDTSDKGKIEYDYWPWHATAQYYFLTPEDEFRPYVGAGLHYTKLSSYKINHQTVKGFSVDDEYGFLFQAGGIYNIDDSMFVDFSARYFYLEPKGKVKVGGGSIKIKDMDVNPWVFNVSVGIKI